MIDIIRAMIEKEAQKLAGEAGESVQLQHVHSAISNVSAWFHEAREALVREHGAPMAAQPRSSSGEVVAVESAVQPEPANDAGRVEAEHTA